MKSKQESINYSAAGLVKQPYEKPRLRTIELITGEVLALGCKVDDGQPGKDLPIGCGTLGCQFEPGS